MNKANTIVFSTKRYDNNRDKMYQAIAKQLMILMDNECVCKVYDDDVDIVMIEFEHDEKKDYWGGMELCWLKEDEVEAVKNYILDKEMEDDIK